LIAFTTGVARTRRDSIAMLMTAAKVPNIRTRLTMFLFVYLF
jgi:hypothetical protein